MPKSKAKSPALSNPTHEVRGPDGTGFFVARIKGRTLRVRILFAANGFEAGDVNEHVGQAGHDDFMMGRWVGILAYLFGGAAIDALPVGTTAYELGEPRASLYDFKPYVETRLSDSELRSAAIGLMRAGFGQGRTDSLPVVRADLDRARDSLTAHKAALLDGSFRRCDGPMVENTAPKVPGVSYYPTYVKAEGTPVPDDLLPAFVADADMARRYLDVLDSIPDLPTRPRTRPATPQELRDFATYAGWTFKPEPLRAYARQVVETGVVDLVAAEAAERERIRLANIETEQRREAAAA